MAIGEAPQNAPNPEDADAGGAGAPHNEAQNAPNLEDADAGGADAPHNEGGGWTTANMVTLGLGVVAGAGALLVSPPLVVTALGFTPGGISAGSVGASMMSLSATTGYGATVVSALQGLGAAGFSLASQTVLAGTGGTAGGLVAQWFSRR